MQDGKKIRQELDKIARKVNRVALTVIKVESGNFIKENFAKQGFQGSSFDAWQKRKTIDKKGRDLTRYRTNRVGRKGSLTKFGERNKESRPILTGYASADNKLRNSFTCTIRKSAVRWTSYKKYAKRHNEGLKGMPKRQFAGKSPVLDRRIKKEIDKQMKKLFKA